MLKFKLGILLLMLVNAVYSQDTLRLTSHSQITVVTNPSTGLRSYQGWIVMPSKDVDLRKIVMYVTLACPEGLHCGEWDYSDRINLVKTGGENGTTLNYELSRMLTPYGGYFDQQWHFTWQCDLTDFSLVLRDSVLIDYLHSGYEPNNDRGWSLSLQFELIKGEPANKPISIQKIYDDLFKYGDDSISINQLLKPVAFTTESEATLGILRILQTGHGMDDFENCGEFCNKTRFLYFDDSLIDQSQIWKECGDNPLFPQAGTWVFDRANWCPGYLLQPDDFLLLLKSKRRHTVQIQMQQYAFLNPSAIQNITAYLIQMGPFANRLDVSLEEVLAPSSKDLYSKINPITHTAIIQVKNRGSEIVKSLEIHYGTRGSKVRKFIWHGNINSNQTQIISLPGIIESLQGANTFDVEISSVNEKKDAYPFDNRMSSRFNRAPQHDSRLVFYLQTNNQPEQNGYKITDEAGKIIYERPIGSLKPNTIYRDSLEFKPGGYTLQLEDTAGDGLEFWYNSNGGKGYARLYNQKAEIIKSFNSDCGSGFTYSFQISETPDATDSSYSSIDIYPRRFEKTTTLNYNCNTAKNVDVMVMSNVDSVLLQQHSFPNLREGQITLDMEKYALDLYIVKVYANGSEVFKSRIRKVELPKADAYEKPNQPEILQSIQKWSDWKFGVIIHWGPYSQWSVVESWSICPEDESWCQRMGDLSNEYFQYRNAYKGLGKRFNPSQFNPEEWAQLCSNAGMKYMVFTTKHHDGFCMFDSKQTDYSIANSAFSQSGKRDITSEVFDAFRKKGMGIGAYFSKPDWNNDDYWWSYFPPFDRNVNYDPKKHPQKWNQFQRFTQAQINEITSNYGALDILWLDGGWVRPEHSITEEIKPWLGKNQWVQDIDMEKIAKIARKNQPNILLVDRSVGGPYENYKTTEQQIPQETLDYPWESCISLGDNWYSADSVEHYKSSTWVIHTLIKIVSKGGNFLLGIGPDSSGSIVPEVQSVLIEVGKWMSINGESIYKTKPLQLTDSKGLYFTQTKDLTTRFAFKLLDQEENIPNEVEIPFAFWDTSSKVFLLGYPKPLKVKNKKDKIFIQIPTELKSKKGLKALVFTTHKVNEEEQYLRTP